MNIPRLLLTIVVAFVVIFATDYLIHGVWLMPDYAVTKALWRPDTEMNARIGWMFFAQFLCAATFVLVWAMGFAGRSIGTGIIFGFVMGLFQQIWAMVDYVVLPMPCTLATKWFCAGLVQAMLLGIVAALIYKPRAATV